MSQGDWLTAGSVVIAIGPAVVALVWLAYAGWKTDGKEEV